MSAQQQQQYGTKNLSHYEILGPLGRGSNSFVYKAKCVLTGNTVALKVIDITNGERKLRAKKEVQLHKSLSHENIVTYIDDFKDDSYWYLVLEYCEKGELYSHLKRRNFALTEDEIRHIGIQLLRALEYLESRNIAHLDVKLGNIFINKEMLLKLGDFGFAEVCAQSLSDSKNIKDSATLKASDSKLGLGTKAKSQSVQRKNSKVSLIAGTPSYIAPETLEIGYKSPKSDIWSSGCVLYALATGKTPFEAQDISTTLVNITTSAVHYPPHLSANFIAALRSAFQRNPHKRISARQLLEAPFFDSKYMDESTVSTIAPETEYKPREIQQTHNKRTSTGKPNYLNQVDRQTICDIVKRSYATRNKSSHVDAQKGCALGKSIKSKRLINEMLGKQSALASNLQAKYVLGKLESVGKKCMQKNVY